MASIIEFSATAKKQLAKIDRVWQQNILDYLSFTIAPLDDPRLRGKALVGDKRGLWRYRVGDYRVICAIENSELVILVLLIAHRREVYD